MIKITKQHILNHFHFYIIFGLALLMLPIYIALYYFSFEPFAGDGAGYWRSSNNLLNLDYILDNQKETHFNIGYPLFITFFRLLGFNEFGIVLLNFCLHFSSIIFLYFSLNALKISRILSAMTTIGFALYFPLYQTLPQIMSEAITAFSFSGITYFAIRIIQHKNTWNIVLLGFFFALLMTVRALAPYAIISTLVLLLVFKIERKNLISISKSMLFAFLLCTPYLIYTYTKTSNFFYWTSQGGSAMYFMASPHKGDLDFVEVNPSKQYNIDAENRRLHKIQNHLATIKRVEKLNVFEEDKILKELALNNLKKHPTKYIQNWINNINRMMFGTPFSYSQQHPLAALRILPNAIIYVLLLLALISFVVLRIRKNSQIFTILTSLALAYLGLSSLVTSMPRYAYTLTPILLVIIAIQLNPIILKLLAERRKQSLD
jgi:hypothetical protein